MPKARKPLSMAKHVLGVWALSPIVLGAAGYCVWTALDGPSGEVATVTMIGVVIGLALGWALGLFAFAMRWGLRGWAVLIERFREGRQAQRHENAQALASDIPDHHLGDDPWGGQNEYGCCRDNVDAEGYPTHGAPGCRHPQARLYARA